MDRLEDKVALITGGESGIGLATARLFVSKGASVHLVGINNDQLSAAVLELGDDHASSLVADVTDESAVQRAVAAGVDRYGRFDVVVSNAGISGERPRSSLRAASGSTRSIPGQRRPGSRTTSKCVPRSCRETKPPKPSTR